MNALSVSVLRLLADAEFHSGQALAAALDVTRGTIWNAVRALKESGLEIYSVQGRGYRLAEPLSMLDAASIARHAGAERGYAIEVIDAVDSTNTLLMTRAAAGAPSGTIVAAEWQHGGRGRMGRPWHAALGGALAFSLLWRFEQGAAALAGLSLAIGVALTRALRRLGAEVELKWPNDVLWRGSKLAGLLLEMQGDALGPSNVVIGIGLNVRLTRELERRIDQPAADLESACGRSLDRNYVFGAVLAELAPALATFSREGFGAFRDEWHRYHAHQDRRVSIALPGGRFDEGYARGVAEDGALLFESGNAVRRLHSGEISVRA